MQTTLGLFLLDKPRGYEVTIQYLKVDSNGQRKNYDQRIT